MTQIYILIKGTGAEAQFCHPRDMQLWEPSEIFFKPFRRKKQAIGDSKVLMSGTNSKPPKESKKQQVKGRVIPRETLMKEEQNSLKCQSCKENQEGIGVPERGGGGIENKGMIGWINNQSLNSSGDVWDTLIGGLTGYSGEGEGDKNKRKFYKNFRGKSGMLLV